MTTTPEQIEAIARAYCVKLGRDPDEGVEPPMPEYMLDGKNFTERNLALCRWKPPRRPLWITKLPEVREALAAIAMREAIQEALDKPK